MTESTKTTYEVTFKHWTDSQLFEKLGRMYYYYDFCKNTEDDDIIINLIKNEISTRNN